jgi:hypothetical protein
MPAAYAWSPYTIKHKRLVENVQRRTTKFILDYPQDLTYANRLAKIKILPPEFRRDISDLCLLFKYRTGAITTDVNKYICTFEPGYQSRNYDKNNYNLIIKYKQDYFRNSFFIRTVELWNTLPSHVKSSNSYVFSSLIFISCILLTVIALRTSGHCVISVTASTHCDLLNRHPAIFIIFTNML